MPQYFMEVLPCVYFHRLLWEIVIIIIIIDTWYSAMHEPHISVVVTCTLHCFFLHRPLFLYCVIPSWGGATPCQINSLGSIQACNLKWAVLLFIIQPFSAVVRSTVLGHVLTDHTCSFMCTNHIDMIVHNPAFLRVRLHSVNSCMLIWYISHSRARQASHLLAASSCGLDGHPSKY